MNVRIKAKYSRLVIEDEPYASVVLEVEGVTGWPFPKCKIEVSIPPCLLGEILALVEQGLIGQVYEYDLDDNPSDGLDLSLKSVFDAAARANTLWYGETLSNPIHTWTHVDKSLTLYKGKILVDESDVRYVCRVKDQLTDEEIQTLQQMLLYGANDD